MRSVFSLVGLTLVLAGLCAYWWHLRTTAESDPGRPPAPPMLQVDAALVARMHIQVGAEQTITVRHDSNGAWHLESPLQAPADTYLTERVLIIMNRMPAVRAVSDGDADLAQYGLDPPQTRITVETPQATHWLALGKSSATESLVYARSSGLAGVHLVPQDKVRALPKHPADFLDPRLFPIARDPLHTIEAKLGAVSFRLQSGAGGWSMVAPVRSAADHQAMAEWLQRLRNLEFVGVRPRSSGKERRPVGRWIGTLRLSAGTVSLTGEFFQAGDALVVRRSDLPSLEFELSGDVLNTIFPNLFTLRDKHLTLEGPDAVTVVEVLHRAQHVRLERHADGWSRQGRPPSAEGSDAVRQWLTELQLTQVESVLDRLDSCRALPGSRWKVLLRGARARDVAEVELARTERCGDAATLPTGEWAKLPTTWLIDRLPGLSGSS